MVKVDDNIKLEKYINKNKLNNMFSENMKEYMTLYMFSKNEYICKEGEVLESMFFLVEGKAKVYKILENGRSILLSFYNPIKIIGDVELVRSAVADCNVQVIKDTYCIGINFNIVRSKLIKDCKFLLNICNYLGEKISISSNNSSINLLYPLENRLASYMIAYINIEDRNNKKFIFKESYHEIAELLGTSYRHLNRTLNKLCHDGILKKDGREYTIEDFDKLSYLAGDLYK